MLYVEYDEIREKYAAAQRAYNDLIDEKAVLFQRTQPGAIEYDKEHVSGGTVLNPFDEYVVIKDRLRLDERIAEMKSILEDRKTIKDMKESELRSSKDWHDRIYAYWYLDKMSLTKIERFVPYSRVQIWRILKIIRNNLET